MISALVNKGNVLYARSDYEKAREFYKEALQNDSSCVEGLYNLGAYVLMRIIVCSHFIVYQIILLSLGLRHIVEINSEFSPFPFTLLIDIICIAIYMIVNL